MLRKETTDREKYFSNSLIKITKEKKMFYAKIVPVILAALFCSAALPAVSAQEKKEEAGQNALILCAKGYFNNWLKHKLKVPGLKLSQYDEQIKGKNWKENGRKLPPLSELKKYDLVLITGTPVTAAAKKDFLAYLNEGGSIYMLYTSLSLLKEKTGEIAFGAGGFDGFEALHHKPYDMKTRIPVKYKYTKEMGREREFTLNTVYTVAVKDLVDAKPLILVADKPGLVNTCYTKVGKGMFIYSGFEDLETVSEVLKVLGFAKK